MTVDGDRILLTHGGTGTLGGLTHLLWWDPSVRVVLVSRDEHDQREEAGDETGDKKGTDFTAYVDQVRTAIELTGSDAQLLVSC